MRENGNGTTSANSLKGSKSSKTMPIIIGILAAILVAAIVIIIIIIKRKRDKEESEREMEMANAFSTTSLNENVTLDDDDSMNMIENFGPDPFMIEMRESVV